MVDFIELTARDSATTVKYDHFSSTDRTLVVHQGPWNTWFDQAEMRAWMTVCPGQN
ncbi:MAG TPA: hypothetical protein PLZ93_00105 [Nocardioides sp.]|mgnify:CR=1 FL=1|uniref:hypothetical protein n=1 Tax=uncultured Nocardioides sp. TaxID=198441 RepID=UPI0026389504|nr:hypothetical protein [uncultured Nocardioides sp.]HRI93993.1 hypothetical protein [Nocardioides sp.]HRK44007.1 hypothetical protein [Nocardioides sp.]